MRGEGVRRGGHQPACSLLCLSEMSTGSFSRKARVSLSKLWIRCLTPSFAFTFSGLFTMHLCQLCP